MSETIRYETDHGEVVLTKETVRKYLVSGGGNTSDQEITMFLALCKYQQLNPYLREAYLIKYKSDTPATMIVGKDTFTKRAANNENYDGCEAGVIVVDGEGEITNREGTLVLNSETLVGGWAKGYRKDWDKPVFISVNFSEYEGKKKDGSTNKVWKKQPATMIRKIALVQMLRELFPDKFQGLYDSAEMGLDSTDLPEKTVTMPKERDVTPKGKEDGNNSKKSVSNDIVGQEKPKDKQDPSPIAETATEPYPIPEDKISEMKGKCERGIKIMVETKLIDDGEQKAFDKELQEYVNNNDLQHMEGMYKELHELYFERQKSKGK